MTSAIGYALRTAVGTRGPLLPLAASLFAVIGVFLDPRNDPGSSWGLCTVLSTGLVAWTMFAIADAEPGAQADMASAAMGGHRVRHRVLCLVAVLLAIATALLFVLYPVALDALVRRPVFSRPLRDLDVVAAAVSVLCGGLVGGAAALLVSPPRDRGRATAAGALLVLLLGLVVVGIILGGLGGPMATGSALADAAPGRLPASLIVGWVTSLALGASLAAAAGKRSGR